MTSRDALDRVNGHGRPDLFRQLFESGPVRVACAAFAFGVAVADLHAEIRENRMAAEAQIALLAGDVHALKVLACRSYVYDSVCALTSGKP